MPIYSYMCKKCMFHFDKLVKSYSAGNDLDSIECPHCKTSNHISRVWHTVGSPIFKGNGFYTTDYAKKQDKGESSSPPSKVPSAPEGA